MMSPLVRYKPLIKGWGFKFNNLCANEDYDFRRSESNNGLCKFLKCLRNYLWLFIENHQMKDMEKVDDFSNWRFHLFILINPMLGNLRNSIVEAICNQDSRISHW